MRIILADHPTIAKQKPPKTARVSQIIDEKVRETIQTGLIWGGISPRTSAKDPCLWQMTAFRWSGETQNERRRVGIAHSRLR